MIDLILSTLFEKNPRELLHSKRVSVICREVATALNLSKDDIEQVAIAGLIHDIGKIGIDEQLLNSVSKLSIVEIEKMNKHAEIGFRILNSVNEFSEIAIIVLSHHEKWNGQGYPRKLKGEEIPLLARIVTLSDSFDAMTRERTYKRILTTNEALKEIEACSGSQFDPVIVKLFIDLVRSGKIESLAQQ